MLQTCWLASYTVTQTVIIIIINSSGAIVTTIEWQQIWLNYIIIDIRTGFEFMQTQIRDGLGEKDYAENVNKLCKFENYSEQ
jgi:hypothetical protein